ncbi:hypothetical protein SEA_MACGULLY_89 [Rhodococcus phage MacGully]|nr:hypothetical protein SEA_MACGULLY_89 [Rhodococcus phage MacGully]
MNPKGNPDWKGKLGGGAPLLDGLAFLDRLERSFLHTEFIPLAGQIAERVHAEDLYD